MVGSGAAMILSGGGIYIAKTLGTASIWITAFNISGLALAILGTSATTIQFYRYLKQTGHAHND